jgi:hypothetical protein
MYCITESWELELQSNLPNKDMLRTSNLIREVEASTREPGYNDTTVLNIALSYVVKALIFHECLIILIKYKGSTSL